MYKFSDYISSVVVEMYLIQITSLSCVGLSDVNSTSGLRLRILSRLAVVEITTEKIAVKSFSIWARELENVAAYSVYDMLSQIALDLLHKV